MATPVPVPARDSSIRHLGTAVRFTIVTILIFGIAYPVVMWGLSSALFPAQAAGSLVTVGGKIVGSTLVGQAFTKPQYFHPRPSAAGKGYDPTSTGGTNLGPTSKKLIDSTKVTIEALVKENPDASGSPPMDLVTSSASGIDPDISPEAARYQAPRVAKARGLSVVAVTALIAAHERGRDFGILGEPRVNVLELNRALDDTKPNG
jgi:K+-transporting ATPase ATPase C chain